MKIYYMFYRWFMRLAHRYGWHYAPMRGPLEDGATQRWCQWCGFRETYHTQGNWNTGHLATPIFTCSPARFEYLRGLPVDTSIGPGTDDVVSWGRYSNTFVSKPLRAETNGTCRGCGTIGPLLRTET